jgi:hypothetical protein
MIEPVRALPVDRGLECRSARMTDMRGRRARTQTPGIDPAAAKMWSRVGSEMPATHTHSPATEMSSATTHSHGAAAKMSSAPTATEVSTATATTEVAAASTAADMSATAPTPETAATSRVSNSRQAKGQPYCGRARRDFPHGTTSLSGPNAASQRQIARSVPAE